jgi:peroxiredoxin
MNQVFAVDVPQGVWSFTAVPRAQTLPLFAGEAPDFSLADRNGRIVRLSDFRGKKVLILTWASWCGCRFDLAGWQKVYDELKDKGFEIMAAAQDTGGPKIADPWYEKAHVTFTALVDPQHTVSSLYQMVNVPTGVWVDEAGKIVRPSEVAYSKQQRVLNQPIGDDRYAAGLRDWVRNGAQSDYVVPSEKLRSRLSIRTANERLADAHFKLGAYFLAQDKRELATQHWQESQKLNPDNWNYHRQEWSFDKSKEMNNFLAKVRQLGNKPYYGPVEFPPPKPNEEPPAPKP